MLAVLVLLMIGLIPGNLACPDGTKCQDKNTCCPTRTGYGCCKYPSGQCCRDGLHCCPLGFRCDITSTRCLRGELSLTASPHIAAIQSNSIQKLAGIIHCSDRFYCPAGNSCCKTPTGQLACCPYPLGQCCKDGKHCCEYGYNCNPTFTKCISHYASVPALLTKKALVL
ncbi:progranulin-like [Clarias gariepinus]|uniref:granulin 2 n=1 Tax=Clarias gariepinus TaxID=13013 RepID=UPI00234DFE96|nr:granulin 2 [Clarias gariepinus]